MFDEVLSMIQAVDDVSVHVCDEEHAIYARVEDFEGFDDHWREVFRDYDEEAVDALYDALYDACEVHQGDFYEVFVFDGFEVVWECASDDI